MSWSEKQETRGVKTSEMKKVKPTTTISVLSVSTIYDQKGLELKKLINIGLGWEIAVNLNLPEDSASPVSFF